MPKQLASGHFEDFGKEGNLDASLGSVAEFHNLSGYPTIGFTLIVPTGGKVVFEGTSDGSTWISTTFRGVTTDGYLSETSTSETFIGSIAGLRKVRVRVVEAGSAVGKFEGRAQRTASVLEGIEHSNPPHKFGYKCIRKDVEFATTQINTAIWTPPTNRKFVVTDLIVNINGNTDGRITIFDENNTQNNRLFNSRVRAKTDPTFGMSLRSPFVSSSAGNILRVTTDAAITVSIIVFGYESES